MTGADDAHRSVLVSMVVHSARALRTWNVFMFIAFSCDIVTRSATSGLANASVSRQGLECSKQKSHPCVHNRMSNACRR